MRKSSAISLFCFVLHASCAFGATEPAARPLTFGWNTPGEFLIMDTADVNGTKSVLVYNMQTITPKTKDFFVLKWGEMGVLSLGGKAVTQAHDKQVQQIKRAYATYPDMKISAAGKFLGVIEQPLLTDPFIATRETTPDESLSDEARAQQQARAVLKGVMKNSWSCWAGAWVGLQLKDGESIKGIIKEDSPFPGGTPIDVHVTVTRVGKSKDFPSGVHFRMTGVFDPDDLRQASAEVAQMLMDKPEAEIPTIDEIAKRIEVSGGYSFEVVTDPTTLKPFWASQQRTCLLTFGKVQEFFIESHDYAFEWLKDTPPAKPQP